MEFYLYFTLLKTAKKQIFFHQTINLDVYFHLLVHKISKINVHISKPSIYLPWLRLESRGFARFLGSVTGPQLVLVALCPPPKYGAETGWLCTIFNIHSIVYDQKKPTGLSLHSCF